MLGQSKIGAICHYVTDPARTETFYRDILGMDMTNMGDDGSGNDWLQATTAGGIDLIFFKQDGRSGHSPIIVFELAHGGIDAIVQNLALKGVTIVNPVSEAPGGWSAEIADPDGHTISMFQPESIPRAVAQLT